MTTVLTHVRLVTGAVDLPDAYIRFGEHVDALGPMRDFRPVPNETRFRLDDRIVTPGFIDVHSHGGYGVDAMDGDPATLVKMVTTIARREGVTSYFPTTMTQSKPAITRALTGITVAAKATPLIQGIHLEGPFISPVYKGAQPAAYILPPDAALLAEWQALTGGRIRLVTYAPEVAGAAAFEAYCLAHDIILSIGHSDATRAVLKNSAATHTTHLYNGQRLAVHREPGVMGHTLLEDNITAEMIMDGFHNAPDMVELAYRLKGPHRLELITDAMRAKGLGDGDSELGGQHVTVKNGHARLDSGMIAGSVLTFDQAFRNSLRFTTASLLDAVQMASVNQAREFGLTQKGVLAIGKDADLNVFSPSLRLEQTYSLGKGV